MKKTLRQLTFKAAKATEAETWQAIEQKAEENGFIKAERYDYSQIWTSEVRKCTVYESFYHKITGNQEERLHIICENNYKQSQKDREIEVKYILMD